MTELISVVMYSHNLIMIVTISVSDFVICNSLYAVVLSAFSALTLLVG